MKRCLFRGGGDNNGHSVLGLISSLLAKLTVMGLKLLEMLRTSSDSDTFHRRKDGWVLLGRKGNREINTFTLKNYDKMYIYSGAMASATLRLSTSSY